MSPPASKRQKLDVPIDLEQPEEGPSSTEHNKIEGLDRSHEESSVPERYSAKDSTSQQHEHGRNLKLIGGELGSNLLKLQVDELLAGVQPSYEKILKGVEDILHKMKNLIEKVEPREPQSISEASRFLQKSYGITVPYPEVKLSENIAYKVAYGRPSCINIVGSYILKTMIKSKSALGIDLIVVMPHSIFQSKDFLNYRYFYKRAFYLACIAATLESSSKDEFTYHFQHLHGNDLHPILIARPKCNSSAYEIRIIPTAPQKLFTLPKLRPNRNLIRSKKRDDLEPEKLLPTPFYNSSLSSDCNFESYLKLLYSTSKSSLGFKDACIMGRIWLQQRGFDGSICGGGFGHFEWAAMCALLEKESSSRDHPTISSNYSSFQIFRTFLKFLSMSELTVKPFVTQKIDIGIQRSNAPIFYDSRREHNLLYKMSPWSYKLLKLEANTTLDMLSDENYDHFDSIFITKISQPLLRFDFSFSISHVSEKLKEISTDHILKTRKFVNLLYRVLREGLRDRVRLIHIKEQPSVTWPVKSRGYSLDDEQIMVSVLFDSQNVDRLVDYGPSAEDEVQAAKFRNFWGEKAELRRFQDGRILETLVWPDATTQSLIQNIVKYLIDRHCDSRTAKSINFMESSMESILSDLSADHRRYQVLQKAFKSLESRIRSLEGLPLQVKQLSAVDPQLRYTSIESPSFGPGRPMNNPADVLIEFEGSGRWPDELAAIQRTKLAFLLRIGSLLEDAGSIKTRLGLENESRHLQNCGFLDVIFLDGPVFRLRVLCDREQILLQRQITDKSIERHLRDDAVSALSIYKKTYIQLPLLTQSICTHCTRFPQLSSSIRLVKLWFNRHMLCRHLSEEIIELIVARAFLQPHPWQIPSSITTTFLRIMMFLSKWNWRATPLIVDFSGTITKVQINSINTQLEAWRKIDPALNRTVLFAASNHDLTGTAFSDHSPSKMIATRMTALARSAYKMVKDFGYNLDINPLFTTSIFEYDFVIYLSKNSTNSHHEKKALKLTPKNLELQSEENFDKIGYQPVQLYLKELEILYSNNIVFFHENFTGSLIAGLWNPQCLHPRPFKVNLSYSTKRVCEENDKNHKDEVVINQASILAEIARLGGDMVSKIVTRKES